MNKSDIQTVIFGCGDIGKRIARQLIEADHSASTIHAYVHSEVSAQQCLELGLKTVELDLDSSFELDDFAIGANLIYLVAPQKDGHSDQRTERLLAVLSELADKGSESKRILNRVVLISTTGVYGDSKGAWVTEESATSPQTDRGRRRIDAERQWQSWCSRLNIPMVILRVPGIYAHSRIPTARLEKAIPVVRAEECGYSNRIHAEDLAMVSLLAIDSDLDGEIFNVSDGSPGKITQYLQAAAEVLGLPALPEISMQQAQVELSAGMLSYLSESRKISNAKMLHKLKVTLRYPDFRIGLRH